MDVLGAGSSCVSGPPQAHSPQQTANDPTLSQLHDARGRVWGNRSRTSRWRDRVTYPPHEQEPKGRPRLPGTRMYVPKANRKLTIDQLMIIMYIHPPSNTPPEKNHSKFSLFTSPILSGQADDVVEPVSIFIISVTTIIIIRCHCNHPAQLYSTSTTTTTTTNEVHHERRWCYVTVSHNLLPNVAE